MLNTRVNGGSASAADPMPPPSACGVPRHWPGPSEWAAVLGRSATLLLVEDDRSLLEVVKEELEQGGYTVLAATSGPEALALAYQHRGPIDLLLTDVVMPEMSGHELRRRLSMERPDLRVLFLSGYPPEYLARKGLETDPDLLLAKPFASEALHRRVWTLLTWVES